jgi:hypothetical protein
MQSREEKPADDLLDVNYFFNNQPTQAADEPALITNHPNNTPSASTKELFTSVIKQENDPMMPSEYPSLLSHAIGETEITAQEETKSALDFIIPSGFYDFFSPTEAIKVENLEELSTSEIIQSKQNATSSSVNPPVIIPSANSHTDSNQITVLVKIKINTSKTSPEFSERNVTVNRDNKTSKDACYYANNIIYPIQDFAYFKERTTRIYKQNRLLKRQYYIANNSGRLMSYQELSQAPHGQSYYAIPQSTFCGKILVPSDKKNRDATIKECQALLDIQNKTGSISKKTLANHHKTTRMFRYKPPAKKSNFTEKNKRCRATLFSSSIATNTFSSSTQEQRYNKIQKR